MNASSSTQETKTLPGASEVISGKVMCLYYVRLPEVALSPEKRARLGKTAGNRLASIIGQAHFRGPPKSCCFTSSPSNTLGKPKKSENMACNRVILLNKGNLTPVEDFEMLKDGER